MVDFAGWDMPLHYGSQLEEHRYVRQDAGVFDVSHMTIVDITGAQACDFLRYLLANDVGKLKTPGKALYSCMLNEAGGVIDDLIVYRLSEQRYRLVVNASTRAKDLAWINQHGAKFAAVITLRADLAILAVQGPNAIAKTQALFPPESFNRIVALNPFEVCELGNYCIARTGYTGEDGLEIMLPADEAANAWEQLLSLSVQPAGLGARDTLRLEAGLNLYGADMDEHTSPLESNLAWTIAWQPAERDFIGRAALEQQKAQVTQRLVGLILEQKGVLRSHQKVYTTEGGVGEITSGGFSPTLQQGIALARLPITASTQCWVDIRGQKAAAQIVKPPFVRHGKKVE